MEILGYFENDCYVEEKLFWDVLVDHQMSQDCLPFQAFQENFEVPVILVYAAFQSTCC